MKLLQLDYETKKVKDENMISFGIWNTITSQFFLAISAEYESDCLDILCTYQTSAVSTAF